LIPGPRAPGRGSAERDAAGRGARVGGTGVEVSRSAAAAAARGGVRRRRRREAAGGGAAEVWDESEIARGGAREGTRDAAALGIYAISRRAVVGGAGGGTHARAFPVRTCDCRGASSRTEGDQGSGLWRSVPGPELWVNNGTAYVYAARPSTWGGGREYPARCLSYMCKKLLASSDVQIPWN